MNTLFSISEAMSLALFAAGGVMSLLARARQDTPGRQLVRVEPEMAASLLFAHRARRSAHRVDAGFPSTGVC